MIVVCRNGHPIGISKTQEGVDRIIIKEKKRCRYLGLTEVRQRHKIHFETHPIKVTD